MLTTVVFDLGGVYFTSGTETALRRLSLKYHIPLKKVRDAYLTRLRKKYPTTEKELYKIWNSLKKDFGVGETPEELDRVDLDGYVPQEKTISVLRKLRSDGVRVLYLSDNTIDRVRFLNGKYGFLDDFDGGVFSFDIRSCKPDVRMYQTLLKKFKLNSCEVVFIDDRKENLLPARKLRMRVIQFKNQRQLRRDLRTMGFAL